MHGRIVPLLAITLLLGAVTSAAAQQEDFSDTYAEVSKSVVLIDFADGGREVGSGVIVGITKAGKVLILTANHVVEGYDEVIVRFAGSTESSSVGNVSIELYAAPEDLAIIVVDDPPEGIDVIRLRKSQAEKGEDVGTIGHPRGEPFTFSNGAITNIHGKYVTHDARLERGSSGGPLLDDCSRMVGMNVHLIRDVTADSVLTSQPIEGTSVALGVTAIASILDGWFPDTRFEKKWEYKTYCSFWQRLYKQPAMWVVEAVTVGGIVYLLWPDDEKTTTDPEFGNPPGPPASQ